LTARKRKSAHVTIVDVAERSGFSPSTVSIVLNEAPLARYVAASTKEHIRKIALAMGYRPDASARSLRRRRSQTIGIMVFDISDPFCTLILQGIEQTIFPSKYLPILMDAHNQRKHFERYLEMLLELRVEGLIVIANWLFGEFDLLGDIKKNNIPTVGVGRDLTASGIRSVQVDNEAGGYAAAEHLYRLGHREIAVIRGPKELGDSNRRWEGIQSFAREAKLKLKAERIAQLPAAVDPTSGFDGGLRLTTEMIRSKVPFTALIAFDDLTAFGAVRALGRAGRSVPRDCSVIGFDDVPQTALSSPAITTVRQPMEEMGNLAAKWTLDALQQNEGSGSLSSDLHLLAPSIVVRESTAKA
jgi:DNA-binding LacI/PurR family transcriptional regulator